MSAATCPFSSRVWLRALLHGFAKNSRDFFQLVKNNQAAENFANVVEKLLKRKARTRSSRDVEPSAKRLHRAIHDGSKSAGDAASNSLRLEALACGAISAKPAGIAWLQAENRPAKCGLLYPAIQKISAIARNTTKAGCASTGATKGRQISWLT